MVTGQWEALTPAQRAAVQALRDQMTDALIAKIEAFYREHPDLRILWGFQLEPVLREKQQQEEVIRTDRSCFSIVR